MNWIGYLVKQHFKIKRVKCDRTTRHFSKIAKQFFGLEVAHDSRWK